MQCGTSRIAMGGFVLVARCAVLLHQFGGEEEDRASH